MDKRFQSSFKRPKVKDFSDLAEKSIHKNQKSTVSWIVFCIVLGIVLVNLTSVLFPALIVRSTSIIQDTSINSFEPGVLAIPLLITNFVVFGLFVIHYKKKFPPRIENKIHSLLEFEVSRKVAMIVLIIILVICIASSVGSFAKEETWLDYNMVKVDAQTWSINDVTHVFTLHVKYFLLSLSLKIFGNIRVIPFIGSLFLLVLTYFVTTKMTQKRFAGLVASALLLQSDIFRSYDTSATYDNFWILLYLFSLYVMYKKWYISPISFVLSIFDKVLTVVFLPMTFYFIYRMETLRQKRIKIAISYGVLVAILGIAFSVKGGVLLYGASVGFDSSRFWAGFASWALQLRFDYILVLFLLPVIVGLFIMARSGVRQAESIMVLIGGVLLGAPFLAGFSDITNQPYRFVSLSVFFAIGVGVLLSRKTRKQDELSSSMQ